MSTRAPTFESHRTACSRYADVDTRVGDNSLTSRFLAATPRCADTTIFNFSDRKAFFGNAELRFPLIEAMATPIGILGGVRGAFFFNFGVAGFDGSAP